MLNFFGAIGFGSSTRGEKWRETRDMEKKEMEGAEKTAGISVVSPTGLTRAAFPSCRRPQDEPNAVGSGWERRINFGPIPA